MATPKAKVGEAAPAKAAGEGPAGQAAGESTPGTPAPTAEPTQSSEACQKILTDIGAGDRAALESFSSQTRARILGTPTGMRLVSCLAVAEDDSRFCDALPEDRKAECLQDREVMRELKSLPKEGLKPHIIHKLCMQGSPKAECDKIKAAMTSGDAGKCKDVADASFRTFCEGLASGDAKKCDALPRDSSNGPDRGLCAAFVTDDSSRCRKDSPDCIKLAQTFATAKKEGLEGFRTSDPAVAAARKGKEACAPLVAELKRLCDEAQ